MRVFAFLIFIYSFSVFSQETHYWFHNFGATSSLKGGIDVAGSKNVAAAYYNPAALAFADKEYFEGQADVISFDALKIENFGGDLVDLEYFTTDIAPSLIAYLGRSKKNPNFSFVVGAMTRYNSNLSFILEYEQEGNYLLPDDEKDIFQGQIRYDNRVRENWVIGSIAYKVLDRMGLGLGTYLFVRSQDFLSGYFASAFPKEEQQSGAGEFSKLASNSEEQKLNLRVLGFIFKPSMEYDLDKLHLGLVLTMPSIGLGLLNNYAYKSQLSYLPDEDVQLNHSDSHNRYSGVYKTPFSANFGAEYDFGKCILGMSIEWFSKIDPYEMIQETGKSSSPEFPTAPDENYAIPMMANKSVTNFGLSIRYEIKDWISLIGSFRTDMNYFDEEALSRREDFVPNFTYWDLYHLTTGIKMSSKKLNLTLGIDYANGSSDGDPQVVNMTTASQSNYLRGEINNNTSTRYHNLSFTIGVNLELGYSDP